MLSACSLPHFFFFFKYQCGQGYFHTSWTQNKQSLSVWAGRSRGFIYIWIHIYLLHINKYNNMLILIGEYSKRICKGFIMIPKFDLFLVDFFPKNAFTWCVTRNAQKLPIFVTLFWMCRNCFCLLQIRSRVSRLALSVRGTDADQDKTIYWRWRNDCL